MKTPVNYTFIGALILLGTLISPILPYFQQAYFILALVFLMLLIFSIVDWRFSRKQQIGTDYFGYRVVSFAVLDPTATVPVWREYIANPDFRNQVYEYVPLTVEMKEQIKQTFIARRERENAPRNFSYQ